MRIFFGVVIGGAIGFAIGYFGKCTSSMCPFTNDPLISTIIGALIGGMISIIR
jgi:hypothetical protein